MESLILSIKQSFSTEIRLNDPVKTRLEKLSNELYHRFTGTFLFEPETPYGKSEKELEKKRKLEKDKLEKEIEKLTTYIAEIKDNKIYENAFEWRFEFPDVLNDNGDFVGFDVVIGNPPYIRHEEITHLKNQLEKDFVVFNSSADILTYFFELGNNILRPMGTLSFIVSNKFFRVSYGEKLRSYLMKNTSLNQIIEFDKVNLFDEATVKTAIIDFTKEIPSNTFTYVDILQLPKEMECTINLLGKKVEQTALNGTPWIFQSDALSKISDKISEHGTPLSEWDLKINFGIKTGINEAFLIDEETKKRIILEDDNAEKIIKPLFRGREINKFYSKSSNSFIIGTFPALKLDITNFPSIENHFLKVGKGKLEQSGQVGSRKKSSNKWFETQDTIAFWKELSLPKLIWKRIGSKLRFTYDDSGTYTLDSTCIATGNHLKYLVGVLNSKLIENELNRYAPKTGTGDLIISVQALSPLKIPVPTEEQEIKMNVLVDQILTLKQAKPSADTQTLEKEIDAMVYKLYSLSEEEIKIVEQS